MRHDTEPPASPATRVTPAPHVVTTRLGNELVLLDVDRGDYYSLNQTAARVWDLLAAAGDEGLSAEAAANLLDREYDEPGRRVEADVRAFVADLSQARLVVSTAARTESAT
jgi:hypothetical protein